MKMFTDFLIGIFIMVSGSISMKAQDVRIDVPSANIFNRTELTTIKNILNTGNHTGWRAGGINPTIWASESEYFSHTLTSSTKLPTSVLHWRLANIGGENPRGGNWPEFKWFTRGEQTWYQPNSSSKYNKGFVAFIFKIPTSEISNNVFVAGQYSLNVTHNYGSSWFYVIEFTPEDLKVFLSIPAAISWLTTTPTKYIEISSLNDYRSKDTRILGDLGNAELGNTIDFNLVAKASAANIQFTSSKGVTGTRNISTIQLGSIGSELTRNNLTGSLQNFSSAVFGVKIGNRNNFTPQFSVSAADFKNHFFEAGTYTFQLNLDAKSTDGSVSTKQNSDVTIKVLPLSEITIPNSAQTVNFNFNTAAHYANGQSQVIENQIKLSNNESFELYVKSDENYFKKGGVQTTVNSNILQIGVVGSSLVSLSTSPQKIISGGTPTLDTDLNIKYNIPPAGAQSLVGKDKATYSINVIYSFTAL